MRRLLALCVLLALATAQFVTEAPLASKHAVFVSIALPGHLTPLLGMAEVLLHRGWRCTIVSTDEAASFVHETTATWPDLSADMQQKLQFISLGDMQEVERKSSGNHSVVLLRTEDVFLHASSLPDFQEGGFVIFDWLTDIWRPMYDTLLQLVSGMQPAPAVIIADIMTHAAIDVAETLKLPLILHNADALNVLSPDVLPADDTVPGLFELFAQSDLGFRGRLLYPPARLAGRAVVTLKMDARVTPLRASRHLPPRSILQRTAGYLITHSILAGLEHARALPPLLQLLGPCLPRHWKSLAAPSALPAPLRNWFLSSANGVEDSQSTCLILVNMGTIARLNAQQSDAFFTALHDLPAPLAACASFKVMWKLRAEAQSHLRALLQSGRLAADSVTELPNEGVMIKRGHVEIRVSKWIPSQLALFQLNTLRLFVSHCGINSAHEALFFGIPLICIPLFADQGDMAVRVVDSGAGLMVSKDNITVDAMSDAMHQILGRASEFRAAAARMASLMHAAGGSERGADLIEHVALHGSSMWLLPASWRLSWLVAANVDVALIYAAVCLCVGALVRSRL